MFWISQIKKHTSDHAIYKLIWQTQVRDSECSNCSWYFLNMNSMKVLAHLCLAWNMLRQGLQGGTTWSSTHIRRSHDQSQMAVFSSHRTLYGNKREAVFSLRTSNPQITLNAVSEWWMDHFKLYLLSLYTPSKPFSSSNCTSLPFILGSTE